MRVANGKPEVECLAGLTAEWAIIQKVVIVSLNGEGGSCVSVKYDCQCSTQ